jgi:hypothetical protein
MTIQFSGVYTQKPLFRPSRKLAIEGRDKNEVQHVYVTGKDRRTLEKAEKVSRQEVAARALEVGVSPELLSNDNLRRVYSELAAKANHQQ